MNEDQLSELVRQMKTSVENAGAQDSEKIIDDIIEEEDCGHCWDVGCKGGCKDGCLSSCQTGTR
jgi:hypothetical protein